MSQQQRAEFDATIGLNPPPVIADLPPELAGKTPPAWWATASDGDSWQPPST